MALEDTVTMDNGLIFYLTSAGRYAPVEEACYRVSDATEALDRAIEELPPLSLARVRLIQLRETLAGVEAELCRAVERAEEIAHNAGTHPDGRLQ